MDDKSYSVTFDVDWAPDFAIEHCLAMLDSYKVKATFFATHETDLNQEIVRRGHVLGIHPNFLPNSSHGNEAKEVIEHCLEFVPNAWCMRTHALVQSSPLLHQIFGQFPQLKLDVSLFLHRAKFVQKARWESDGVEFDRLLYNWEDDAEFSKQRFSSDENLFFGNLTVYDFHPIHVFLNSSNGEEYTLFKRALNAQSPNQVSENCASQFRNHGDGVSSFLSRVLSSKAHPVLLSEIP